MSKKNWKKNVSIRSILSNFGNKKGSSYRLYILLKARLIWYSFYPLWPILDYIRKPELEWCHKCQDYHEIK